MHEQDVRRKTIAAAEAELAAALAQLEAIREAAPPRVARTWHRDARQGRPARTALVVRTARRLPSPITQIVDGRACDNARMVHCNIAAVPTESAMADLHRTIDRSISISRRRRRAPAPARAPPTSASASACARRGDRVRSSARAAARRRSKFWRQWARIQRRLRAALGAVLGHAAPARQPVARARGRRQAAGAQVQVRDDRRRARLRAAGELRAGADHSAQGRRRRRHQAAVRDRRSARGPRPGHRRLQGGLRGRRRAVGRPPGVLRDLLSGSRAGPDARRRHRRRSRVHPHRRRAPSATARSR